MADDKTVFRRVLDAPLHSNYDRDPQGHERSYLLCFLYNEILNNFPDYGIVKNQTVDQQIFNKIRDYMQIVQGLINPGPGTKKWTDLSAQEQAMARKWMGLKKDWDGTGNICDYVTERALIPLWRAGEVDRFENDGTGPVDPESKMKTLDPSQIAAKNGKYVGRFLNDFEQSKTWALQLTGEYLNQNPQANSDGRPAVLTIEETKQFMIEETNKIQEAWLNQKKLTEEHDGRLKKNDKGEIVDDDGLAVRAYKDAIEELKKKNRTLRLGRLKGIFKTVGLAAFAGLTVFSGFGLLSYGGFALTAAIGTALSSAGVGGALLCGGGVLGGGLLTKSMFGSLLTTIQKNRVLRRDRYNYVHELGEYGHARGGKRSFLSIKRDYFKSLAIKTAMEIGDWNKLPRKLKKYLPKSVFESQYGKDTKFHRFVNLHGTGMRRLQTFSSNYVSKVEGKGELGAADLSVMLENALSNPTTTLDELADLARRIEDNAQSSGSKLSSENKNIYNNRISAKIIEAVNAEIFENAYTDLTSAKLDNALGNEYISARLSDPKAFVNGENKHVFDTQVLISNISKEQDKIREAGKTEDTLITLNGNLEVTLSQQLTFTQESMEKACARLGVTDGDAVEVSKVVDQILNISSKKYAPIDYSTITNAKAVKYLKFMETKKRAQTGYSESEILAEVSSRMGASGISPTVPVSIISSIQNLRFEDLSVASGSDKSKMEQIKDDVMQSSIPDGEKQVLLKLIQEQATSLEIKHKDEIRQQSIVDISKFSIRDGKTGKDATTFKSIMEQIDAYDFENIKTNNIRNKLYLGTIDKVSPKSIRDYLENYFRLTIEKKLNTEIGLAEKYTRGADAIKNVCAFLAVLTNCPDLLQPQKDRIMEKVKVCINEAILTYYSQFKNKFFDPEMLASFNILLNNSYDTGGLRQYFENKDPAIQAKKEVFESFAAVQDIVNNMKFETPGGDFKFDTPEFKTTFSQIYLGIDKAKVRDHSDKLRRNLVDNIFTLKMVDKYDDDTLTRKLSKRDPSSGAMVPTGVTDVYDKFEKAIDAYVPDPAESNKDNKLNEFASLIVLKNKLIAYMQQALVGFVKKNNGNRLDVEQMFINNPSTEDTYKEIVSVWEGIFATLETKALKLKADLESMGVKNLYWTNVSSFLDKIKGSDKQKAITAVSFGG